MLQPQALLQISEDVSFAVDVWHVIFARLMVSGQMNVSSCLNQYFYHAAPEWIWNKELNEDTEITKLNPLWKCWCTVLEQRYLLEPVHCFEGPLFSRQQ